MEPAAGVDAKKFCHFLVEKAMTRAVGLNPFAIEDELRDGPLAHLSDNFLRGSGVGLDIDLGISDLVLFKEAFSFAAIAAPRRGIDQHMHPAIISTAQNLRLTAPNSFLTRNL
jgi:hypothetical protein